jgi:kumamolisin
MNTGLRMIAVAVTGLICASASAKDVTAVLRLNEKVSMATLAADVNNPASGRYKKFYTPEEIRSISAPSQGEYDDLLATLKADGFEIVSESTTHLWVSVRGDSKLFESTFATQLKTNQNGMRIQMVSAQVPSRLSMIASVVGLDNTRKASPRLVKSALAQKFSGIPQATIKTAYGFDPIYSSGLTGKGQHIAVATYNSFNTDDVNTFYQLSNLKPGPSVEQVNFNGDAPVDADSAIETELDAEFSGMMAPGAAIHVFTSATNDDAGEAQLFTAILDDNRAKVVNYSWGDCEANLKPDHQTEMSAIFARAVAQGVNIMVASGDSGSDGCRNGTLSADWPGANPNVVAVGGTTFTSDGSSMSETGWSGSGGGISVLFSLPDFQKSLTAPYTMRSFPDVAFNADPNSGQQIYVTYQGQTGWMTVGGTSMAAPQWTGFMALVGEARTNADKDVLGFLPPFLYNTTDTQRASLMNDVTSGNNGQYSAGPGWDAVTGLGSMKGNALLTYLSAQ